MSVRREIVGVVDDLPAGDIGTSDPGDIRATLYEPMSARRPARIAARSLLLPRSQLTRSLTGTTHRGRSTLGHRRSPDRVAAERDWRQFVERNAAVIAAAGLPPLATAAVAQWDDFLTHGYLSTDPGGFAVDDLSAAQYASLVELAGNYFAAGYEFYPPIALRLADQAALHARFGDRR